MSRDATASTRRPSRGETVVLGERRGRARSSAMAVVPSAVADRVDRASSTSGAPLTKQRTTFLPSSVISWKVAMSLYSESNGTSASRG